MQVREATLIRQVIQKSTEEKEKEKERGERARERGKFNK